MTGDVRVLHPCKRCGNAGRRRDVYFRERLACSYFACDSCVKELTCAYETDRKVYEAITALGVSHEIAAAMMIAKQATERRTR